MNRRLNDPRLDIGAVIFAAIDAASGRAERVDLLGAPRVAALREVFRGRYPTHEGRAMVPVADQHQGHYPPLFPLSHHQIDWTTAGKAVTED